MVCGDRFEFGFNPLQHGESRILRVDDIGEFNIGRRIVAGARRFKL
jgi:hypothetical protein